jgi:hypothetical protein
VERRGGNEGRREEAKKGRREEGRGRTARITTLSLIT